MRAHLFSRLTFFVLLSLSVGCGSGKRSYTLMRIPHSEHLELQSGELTAEQEIMLARLCPFGQPVLGEFYEEDPVTLIVREGYVIAHNDITKTPIYVCENVLEEDVHGALTGRDYWANDPLLCSSGSSSACERGATDKDYTNSGFDRGHLAPNWNQRKDEQRKRETFYFSNAAPQVGEKFNRSKWQALERKLTEKITDLHELWTISGVLYTDETEDNPETADGFISVETIGQGTVFVPTHFYKIVVWQDGEENHSFSVVMKNREYTDEDSYSDEGNLRSIRWIEERLDVDFMPDLEPADSDDLEIEIGQPFQ